MAKEQETEEKSLIIAPDLFSLLNEEELNPPSYTGRDFIGEVITIWQWEFKQSDDYGTIVIAEVSTEELDTRLNCAFTAWRFNYYFNKIMEAGITTPFRVKVVADKKSYMFKPIEK